jgi:hypothetical protein
MLYKAMAVFAARLAEKQHEHAVKNHDERKHRPPDAETLNVDFRRPFWRKKRKHVHYWD